MAPYGLEAVETISTIGHQSIFDYWTNGLIDEGYQPAAYSMVNPNIESGRSKKGRVFIFPLG